LSLVYRGTTSLSTRSVDELKSIVKMIDLKFPGGFERVELATNEVPRTKPNSINKQSSLKRPRTPSPEKSPPSAIPRQKIPKKDSETNGNRQAANIPTLPSNTSSASKKVSATDRMNMHVSMTLQLKDAPSGTTALCKMPDCGAQVTYQQLSEHFLGHETFDNAKDTSGPVPFPCVACGISFRYRRQLDFHTKNKHGGGMTETERLNLLSDSDTSSENEDNLDQISPQKEMSSTSSRSDIINSSSKSFSQKTVPSMILKRPDSAQSDWSVDKEPANYCNLCDHTFKTTKAKNVHMSTKHASGKDLAPSVNQAKTLMEKKLSLGTFPTENVEPFPSSSTPTISNWKKYGCQICTKRFNEFCQLRTHYTLYHFWDSLSEDYQHLGDKCNICMLKYPTADHLIQHMGNFHCIIDKYLVKKGLRIISEEKTVKLRSWKCEFCQLHTNSNAALKCHLSVKHYQKQLAAEFPIERGKNKKCPKCYKLFEGSSINSVIAHVGSFHDEVIKYAMDVIDLYEGDKDKIPIDDFDDGTIGIPFNKEAVHVYKCETCDFTCESRSDLKDHYLDQHYAGNFMEKFPVPFCQFCDQQYMSLSVLHRHIVKKHEREFASILFQDGITLPSLVSPRRRKTKVVNRGTFDYRFCQICLQEFPTSMMLKIHYIIHYKIHFENNFFTVSCPFCEKRFCDVITTQKHIATDHAEKSLIPLMEKENLWVNKSIVLEPNSLKMKRIEIPLRKVAKSLVTKHFEEMEAFSDEPRHDCVFPSCDKFFDTRKEFLIHLAISHFWKELSLEFEERFSEDPLHCPVCKEKVNPNHDKTTYYKHLAVAHEAVMKYVQTIGRDEPLINQTLPSSSRIPVIRFADETADAEQENQPGNNGSNEVRESEIDRILKKHGAGSLVNGTSVEECGADTDLPQLASTVDVKEEFTTEENLPSTANDFMKKMRNVFESDSDSD